MPNEVSLRLGCEPSSSYAKGEITYSSESQRKYVKRSGAWILEASDQTPINLDAQASELLNKLTDKLDVWSTLNSRFEIDCFCGLFMMRPNEGLSISSDTLRALGERGIELSLEIYSPIDDENR